MLETQKVTFTNQDGLELRGTLQHALGPARAVALFAHCFSCGKDLQAAERIGAHLASQGVTTMRFDFTGLGESEGDFEETTFSSNLGDLLSAAAYLRANYTAPQLLIGHSLGGTAVLAVAEQIPESQAVVTIGAPFDPTHVRRLFPNAERELAQAGVAEFSLGRRVIRMNERFFSDLEAQSSTQRVGSLGRALVIFHSPQDEVVGIDNARRIYEAAKHPKSFVSLDGATHLLPRRRDAEYVAEVIAAWSQRYVSNLRDDDAGQHGSENDDWVIVRGGARGLTQMIRAGSHALVADEPASVGGDDLGPDPYALLLSSLGACTSMTLRMYARRKEWPLEGIEVRLRHRRQHAKDCEECESKQGSVDMIEREIDLAGGLDDAQRSRLLEIADRCPVHRTLRENQVLIRTRLLE